MRTHKLDRWVGRLSAVAILGAVAVLGGWTSMAAASQLAPDDAKWESPVPQDAKWELVDLQDDSKWESTDPDDAKWE